MIDQLDKNLIKLQEKKIDKEVKNKAKLKKESLVKSPEHEKEVISEAIKSPIDEKIKIEKITSTNPLSPSDSIK